MLRILDKTKEYVVYDSDNDECIGCPGSKVGQEIFNLAEQGKKIVWVGTFDGVCKPPSHQNIIAFHGIDLVPHGSSWAELVQIYVENLNTDRRKYNEALKKVRAVKSFSISCDIGISHLFLFSNIEKPGLVALPNNNKLIICVKERWTFGELDAWSISQDGNTFTCHYQSNAITFILGDVAEISPASMLTMDNFYREERHYLSPITNPPIFP